MLSCIGKSAASMLRWVIILILLSIGEAIVGILFPALGYPHRRNVYILDGLQVTVMMTKGLKRLSHEVRLRQLGLFSLE